MFRRVERGICSAASPDGSSGGFAARRVPTDRARLRLRNCIIIEMIPIEHILFISTGLFFIGMYGLFTRRNMIAILMSIELMLNSVNINFVAFNKYLYPNALDGVFFTIFIITIAAAEVALAIAIVINLYRSHHSVDIDAAAELKY